MAVAAYAGGRVGVAGRIPEEAVQRGITVIKACEAVWLFTRV
jgi:hypothetical protein